MNTGTHGEWLGIILGKKRLKYMDVTIAMALRAVHGGERREGKERNFQKHNLRFASISTFSYFPCHIIAHSLFFYRRQPSAFFAMAFLPEMATRVYQFYLFRWLWNLPLRIPFRPSENGRNVSEATSLNVDCFFFGMLWIAFVDNDNRFASRNFRIPPTKQKLSTTIFRLRLTERWLLDRAM